MIRHGYMVVVAWARQKTRRLLHVDRHASSDAALQGLRVGANNHVQVHVSTSTRAGEDRLLDTELGHGLVNEVGLGWAVASGLAVDGSAGRVGAAHGKATGGTGAVGRGLADGAVDERDVEPHLVVDDAVLELGVLAVLQLVGIADLDGGGATAAHGLAVLALGSDLDGRGRATLAYAPDPDVGVAAVVDNGIASGSKGGLESRNEKSRLGEHRDDGCDEVGLESLFQGLTW